MRRIYGFMAIAVVLALVIMAGICSQASVEKQLKSVNNPNHLARLSEAISIQAAGRGNPYINLSEGHDLLTAYVGKQEIVAALEGNRAKPLSLASADFDEDGVPDLVAGYEYNSKGAVVLHRGNVDAIYPNAPEAQQRKREGWYTDTPFLSPALAYEAPQGADFIGAGDFDGDGHWDVVTAKRGGNKLYLLSGDGKGDLALSRTIILQGGVTALMVGDINRRDGLDDIVVGINGEAGAKALVFEGQEGALHAEPEAFDTPAEISSLAFGQLDEHYCYDLIVAAGEHLVLIHGRDRMMSPSAQREAKVRQAEVEQREFPFQISSLAVGDFTGSHGDEIALVGESGAIKVLSRGKPAQFTEDRSAGKSGKLRDWGSASIAVSRESSHAKLVLARVSSMPVDNLVMTDEGADSLQVIAVEGLQEVSGGDISGAGNRGLLRANLLSESEPVAVLPMRLNSDALSDLIVMRKNNTGLSVLRTQANQLFTVTNTNDSGPGSLRQALLDANANPGADTVNFNIGSGIQTININGFLPLIVDAVTIDGTTQPGFAGTPLIELNGTGSTPDYPAFTVYSGNTTIRGLVVTRVNSNGIDLLANGNNILEGNFIGMDTSGTIALGNNFRGVSIGGDGLPSQQSTNNRIGGTVASARNLISGNKVQGVRIIGINSTGNLVQGNFIGTDITGSLDRGNSQEGVSIGDGRNNTIGGTTPGSRNLISGNDSGGVDLRTYLNNTGTTGCLVQGNLIGTDITGSRALGNTNEGVILNNLASGNTVGGTSDAARNIISGNRDGVSVGFDKPVTQNQILGNYIGTDISGNNPVGNRLRGIFINPLSDGNIIRGNLIAFNGTGGILIPNSTSDASTPGVRISILSNMIHSNGGLGIDLGDPGVTPNDDKDFDVGANLQQNFPVLNSSSILSQEKITTNEIIPHTSATVSGTFNSTPNQHFVLEFFFGTEVDTSAQQFINSRPTVLTPKLELDTDANGNAPFTYTVTLPTGVGGGWVNATATDNTGNTSELSRCIQVGTPTPPLRISDVTRDGKHLIVSGSGFVEGAKIFIDGEQRKTIYESSSSLKGKKAAKGLPSGVKIRVRNPDGSQSNEWTYQ